MKSITEYINESNKFYHGRWNSSNKIMKFIKKMLNKHGEDYDIPAISVDTIAPDAKVDGEYLSIDTLFAKGNDLIEEIKAYIENDIPISRHKQDKYSDWGISSIADYYSCKVKDMEQFEIIKTQLIDKFNELCKKFCPNQKVQTYEWDNHITLSVEIDHSGVDGGNYYLYPSVDIMW